MDYKFLQVSGATPAALEELLPHVLERKLSKGESVLIVCSLPEQCERLDEFLWGYEPASFMPHDIHTAQKEGDEAEACINSICLINKDELTEDVIKAHNPHSVLNLTAHDSILSSEMLKGREVLDFFISTDIAQGNARKRWKLLKENSITPSYFVQSTRGGWQKKQ